MMASNYGWSNTRESYKLQRPEYEIMPRNITRCVHIGEVGRIYNKKKLFAHKINSRTINHDMKVLWFSPTTDMNDHSIFGNVSFTIDLDGSRNVIGTNMYYLDQVITKTHVFTRVLLTKRDNLSYERVGVQNDDTPIVLIEGYGLQTLRHVAVSCYKNRKTMQHVLEIAVECYTGLCRQLYAISKVDVINHNKANKRAKNGRYSQHPCHRFNYFNEQCPTSISREETRRIVKIKFPGLLNKSTDLLVLAQSYFMNEEADDTTIVEIGKFELSYDDHNFDISDDDAEEDTSSFGGSATGQKTGETDWQAVGMAVGVGAFLVGGLLGLLLNDDDKDKKKKDNRLQ